MGTKLYLAGKISKNDWRHSIVAGLRSLHPHFEDGPSIPDQWPILEKSINDTYDYTGPFFVSCDHGCYHGRDTHGINSEGCGGPPTPLDTRPHLYDTSNTRYKIVKLCRDAILRSDFVFVWVDSMSVYGSLFEIGFAYANKKRIWWGYPPKLYDRSDLWFAESHASQIVCADTAEKALRLMITNHEASQKGIRDAISTSRPVNGYVYILKSANHYKIGKAKDVDKRVTQISPKTPMPISLLHSIPCSNNSTAERYLHEMLAPFRSNGEWFAVPDEWIDHLVSIEYIDSSIDPIKLIMRSDYQ